MMMIPIGIGTPIIIHSDTPTILSSRLCTAASKRWSVVFSNDANISTLSLIFATPNLVIPIDDNDDDVDNDDDDDGNDINDGNDGNDGNDDDNT